MDDYTDFLDRLAALDASAVTATVRGERTGSAPVAVIRGIAGPLNMSPGWAADDEVGSVAFLPIGHQAPGPSGPAGLLFNREIYISGGGTGRVVAVTLADVDINIVTDP